MNTRNYAFGETISGTLVEVTGKFEIDEPMLFVRIRLDDGTMLNANLAEKIVPNIGDQFIAMTAYSLYRPDGSPRGLGARGPMMPEIFNIKLPGQPIRHPRPLNFPVANYEAFFGPPRPEDPRFLTEKEARLALSRA